MDIGIDPFRASTALRRGRISRGQLRSRCTRLLPDVYIAGRQSKPSSLDLARAGWVWANGAGVLAGWSAAAVLGARWVPEASPSEVVVSRRFSELSQVITCHCRLDREEWAEVDGMSVTTPLRTAYDLGRRLPLWDAVVTVEQLCWMACASPDAVLKHAVLHPGARGVVPLRRAVALADTDSESPWETRARLVVVMAGFPRPQTQIEVFDVDGRFVARVDFGWRCWKVAVEYDGAHHRESVQFARDLRRHNRLAAAGWTVIRVTAADVVAPRDFLAHVARALRQAGARW